MDLSLVPDVVAAAIVLSGTYILIALAWVIVYYAAHLVNFATGELMVMGGFAVATLMSSGQGYWTAALLGLGLVGVVGAIMYQALLRPLAGHALLTPVIVTFGAAIVLQGVILIAWGSSPRFITPPASSTVYSLPGNITLPALGAVIPLIALLIYGATLLVAHRTSVGLKMRAAHESPLLAAQRGVHIYTIFAVAFVVAAIVAALAGVLHTQRSVVHWSVIPLGLKGLVPALVGGLDSIKGVLPGALIVGLTESFTVLYFGARFSDLTVFSLLLVVLLVRPNGLFGTPAVRRV